MPCPNMFRVGSLSMLANSLKLSAEVNPDAIDSQLVVEGNYTCTLPAFDSVSIKVTRIRTRYKIMIETITACRLLILA